MLNEESSKLIIDEFEKESISRYKKNYNIFLDKKDEYKKVSAWNKFLATLEGKKINSHKVNNHLDVSDGRRL